MDAQLIGRTSIRFEFNDFLAQRGGHIGYGVLAPSAQRAGPLNEAQSEADFE